MYTADDVEWMRAKSWACESVSSGMLGQLMYLAESCTQSAYVYAVQQTLRKERLPTAERVLEVRIQVSKQKRLLAFQLQEADETGMCEYC